MAVEDVPEMGRHLRQLVDNAFEEGHFESAVGMLDQLRSPDHKPSIIHILHLIFIALHPIQESQLNEEEALLDPKALLMQSPRKIIKHSKASLTLSASTVIAAQQLLMSFVATNSPQYIGTALPCYPETKNEPPMNFPFSESLIFDQSVAIKHSKNCWEILKSTFKARSTHLLSTPTAKGKWKQTSRIRFVEPSYNDPNEPGDIEVVSDDSWFILEWLVTLFEKDADITANKGQQRYSPLLLNQLPPPPIDSVTRWDACEPIRVIFCAFRQSDSRRQRSGMRLLSLLIELTQTPYLNLPSFATSVLAQLTAIHSETLDQFDTLFTQLSSAPAALSFKIALCKKIIEDASDTSPSEGSRRVSRPKPTGGTARSVTTLAKPRARVRTTTTEGSINVSEGATGPDATANGSTNNNSHNPNLLSPTYVARLPSYLEVVQLLRTTLPFFTFSFPQQQRPDAIHLPNKPWATFFLLTRVRFEFLLAYIFVQVHRREEAEQHFSFVGLDPPDAAFAQSISDGEFATLLHQLFAPQGGNEDEQMTMFKDVLCSLTGLPLTEESSVKMVLT